MKHFEKKLLAKSPHRAFISSRNRQAILGDHDSSKLVANGIDLSYWTRKGNSPQPNCLVYTGVMDYPSNSDGALYFIREILPLVRKLVPEVELLIVGRNPSAALMEAARQHPEVTVTGFVEDMRPYLERAAVYVALLRFASGMQNKLLEAMAMEVPVVTTPIGADGIKIERAQDLPVCVADGETRFAQSVVELLNNPEERRRLAVAGRYYTERNFNWSRSAMQLEQLCCEAVAQAGIALGKNSQSSRLPDHARQVL